ncbi:Alpha/Beta hydrolase protein [Panaeolus papilionaceus]|nr:Alpha/Beta hydrolase protein [Panaeolus papilionaceus]
MPPAIKFWFAGQKYLVAFGALYVLLVALLATPQFQNHALFLNAVRLPFFAKFDTPEKYGLAPNRTINFKLQTPDNESLGAWFVLSERYYLSLPDIPANPADHIATALSQQPVILFLHGNAATRAFTARVRAYEILSSRLGANILAIDYRGFADSTGYPSEQGLVTDSRAAFDWLVEQGKKPEDILVIGHSLGTGVSGQLAAQLAGEKIAPKGFVLLSPFSSIAEVLETYNMFGFIPLMKPISIIPGAAQLIKRAVIHRFDTLQAVPNITAPVLIAHAEDDWDIPDSHSDILFQAFLEPHLPHLDKFNALFPSSEEWNEFTVERDERDRKRKELVKSRSIPNFGRVDSFTADGRTVTLVKSHYGGHDYIVLQEGVVDIIGRTFGFL